MTLPFTLSDPDTVLSTLTLSQTSSNPTLLPVANIVFGGAGANRTLTLTPAGDRSGVSNVVITVSDGTSTSEARFTFTVNPLNDPLDIVENSARGPIGFTIGDIDSLLGGLSLSVTSSNPNLAPTANIVFGGTGASRTVTVTPLANQSGASNITITVGDGTANTNRALTLTVTAGRCYLVSEWLPSGSLADLLTLGSPGHSPLGLADLLDLVRQAAEALAHAHALGIMHGDLTPSNLMLRPLSEGGVFQGYSVRLADIGLAPLFERAEVDPAPLSPGALAYALAPERCQGLPIDARSDIYALGAILYEIVAGQPPFAAETLEEAIFQHVYQPLDQAAPSLPAPIAQLITRCLAKRPEERYQSAADLSMTLQSVLASPALASSSRLRLEPGSEPPGLYEVTVQVRATREVVARLTCVVPTPQPTIGPPLPSPTAVPTPQANYLHIVAAHYEITILPVA